MLGFLVTSRSDRLWNEQEQLQIERVANTIAIAGLLDRNSQGWELKQSQQEELLLTREDLLDNLLHQVRNPLTAIKTFGKLLLKRLSAEDPNRGVANSIVSESNRLQYLLEEFTLPQTESPHLPPKNTPLLPEKLILAPCRIEEVLAPLLESAAAIAEERNLQWETVISPQLSSVQANARALAEVCSNSLDNALKYTPSGGKVIVQVGQWREGFVGIAITDTGIGIAPEDLERVFERHYRGKQAQTGIPGSGLGLAIARDLVRQMQGEIEVISPASPGFVPQSKFPGTRVTIWLPVIY